MRFHHTSQHAFAYDKTSNSRRLHHDLYQETRARFNLPSRDARAVSSDRWALPTRGVSTRWYKNVEARKAGWTGKRYNGLDQLRHYVSPTLSYVYGLNYIFKATGRVSMLTRTGRVALPSQGYARHLAGMEHGAEIGGAKLWYDRSKGRFYLLVRLAICTPDPTPATLVEVVGVDLGQRSSFHPDHATQSHPVLPVARR
jgi:hypothetical protein